MQKLRSKILSYALANQFSSTVIDEAAKKKLSIGQQQCDFKL
jgi:hypothetical protein